MPKSIESRFFNESLFYFATVDLCTNDVNENVIRTNVEAIVVVSSKLVTFFQYTMLCN